MTSAFVTTLRTPALFSMFAKDAVCMSYAQGALRVMSILRPKIIMPDLMEKAYGGLEVRAFDLLTGLEAIYSSISGGK
jgi:proteasome activator subunit 4